MSEKKVVIKINRYTKKIGKNDLVLDNGSCIQVITQSGAFVQYGYAPLIMSKKLFNELKKYDLLYLDVEKTKKKARVLTRRICFISDSTLKKWSEWATRW